MTSAPDAFPVPDAGAEATHVYVSVGHQQMMTDAMKPLGLSVWQLTAMRPMHVAGGRLFVDVTDALASAEARGALLELFGRSDPLLRDALEEILRLEEIELPAPPAAPPPVVGATPSTIATDAAIVDELVAGNEASVAALKQAIEATPGDDLVAFILDDIQELKRLLADPRSNEVIMAAVQATWWLNDRLAEWLGETNAADTLPQSAPGNVTSEMGLALLDVADAIRPHPEVVSFLESVRDDGFLGRLPQLEGGREALDAMTSYLDRFGMRCVGEIDITRPRWSERPSALLPVILADVRSFEHGEGRRRFEEGREQARRKEQDVLERLRLQPGGEQRADETRQMIERVRTFIGYREYPKYGIVSRYFVYKQSLLAEAERLVAAGVLDDRDDIFFLTLPEIADVIRTRHADREMIRERAARSARSRR